MLSLRFAARELRSGVRGFRIFLACLALGVAAIAAAGSTAEAFRRGLATEAREILGGDLSVSSDRAFKPDERRVFARQGRVTYAVGARAMAEAPSGERRMISLRAVDDAYPLSGAVQLTDAAGRPIRLDEALDAGDEPAAAVEQALLDRLGLRVGDHFKVGDHVLVARAVLLAEPDRLSRGFALGPRVLIRRHVFVEDGFLKSAGFDGEPARILLDAPAAPGPAAKALRMALPKTGFEYRDRTDATPGIHRLIDQLEYFLGFIGLASLVAGGLGVAGAVSAYLESRKPSIATLKALGAGSALIRNLYLIQIGALSALGIAIGAAVGAAAPFALGALFKNQLPVPALFALYPEPILRAAAFGALAAAAFSLGPLARARATPPASLFRRELTGRIGWGVEAPLALLSFAGLAALAVWTAPTKIAAAVMIGGVAAAFVILWLMGRGAAWLGGQLRGLASGPLRMGLANLAGPRSAARTASPAIGLGVALLAAVVLIQSSLLKEVSVTAPATAPALVFTEIPGARTAEFDRIAEAGLGNPGPGRYLRMPFTTGRIIALKGQPIDRNRIGPEGRWAYDRDMPMSALDGPPAQGQVVAGRWWPKGYQGPPLISLDARAADAAGLRIGDGVTVNVLGREMDATLAVTRHVEVGSFGPGFAAILDADALKGATMSHVAIAKATRAQEDAVTRALAKPFPEVNVISVREQLEAATGMFDRLALAVRGAAAVAALAGLLVLAGAIASGARARAREAATLKVLGASRTQILTAYAVEYGAVGLIAGAAGTALGYAAAWPVVVKVFHIPWAVDWSGVAALVGGAALLAAIGGLLAAVKALAERPAPVLRAD